MNEPFLLSVTYLGTDQELKARFERWGYTHRFNVLVGDNAVAFEPDEEGSYRAVVTDQKAVQAIDPGLLSAIAAKFMSLHL